MCTYIVSVQEIDSGVLMSRTWICGEEVGRKWWGSWWRREGFEERLEGLVVEEI